jgi:hypothetical protein
VPRIFVPWMMSPQSCGVRERGPGPQFRLQVVIRGALAPTFENISAALIGQNVDSSCKVGDTECPLGTFAALDLSRPRSSRER